MCSEGISIGRKRIEKRRGGDGEEGNEEAVSADFEGATDFDNLCH